MGMSDDEKWQKAIADYKEANPSLWTRAHKKRFDGHVQSVTADERFQGLPFMQQLDLAKKFYLAEMDLDDQTPPAPTENKVTVEHIAGLIVSEEYIRPASASTLTICVLVLRNGFSVTGESACADPANFDAQIGKKIARAAAVEKIWMVEGYLLRQRLHEEKEMGQ